MAWTPEHRRRDAPAITEAVRANAIVRLAAAVDAIDPPARTGRPRLWSTLTMLRALWWLCRAGAARKPLPATYPPRRSIGSRLGRWAGQARGAGARPGRAQRLPAPGARPRAAAQRRDPRHPERAHGPAARPRGYDAAEKVEGRKRVPLTGTGGLIHAIRVVPASVQDRDTPAVIEPELAGGSLLEVRADLAFSGGAAAAPMIRRGIDLGPVGRMGRTGFEVEPERWRIEQTFGVLGRYRRRLMDHEGGTAMSRVMAVLAALFTAGDRFERQITA